VDSFSPSGIGIRLLLFRLPGGGGGDKRLVHTSPLVMVAVAFGPQPPRCAPGRHLGGRRHPQSTDRQTRQSWT
jgi:hypothetical protein